MAIHQAGRKPYLFEHEKIAHAKVTADHIRALEAARWSSVLDHASAQGSRRALAVTLLATDMEPDAILRCLEKAPPATASVHPLPPRTRSSATSKYHAGEQEAARLLNREVEERQYAEQHRAKIEAQRRDQAARGVYSGTDGATLSYLQDRGFAPRPAPAFMVEQTDSDKQRDQRIHDAVQRALGDERDGDDGLTFKPDDDDGEEAQAAAGAAMARHLLQKAGPPRVDTAPVSESDIAATLPAGTPSGDQADFEAGAEAARRLKGLDG